MPLCAASDQGPTAEASKAQLLVVDDEPQVLLAMEDLLGQEYRVHTAPSGARALELMREENEIAVVISDQRMPTMTGAELLERVQAQSNASRILCTGFADLTAVIRAVNHGKIFAYVTKPWQSEDLRMLVRKAVEHFELSAELQSERRLLHDLMDSAEDAICFKSLELRYVRGNRAYSRLYPGLSEEQLFGHKLSELLPECEGALATELEQAEVISSGQSAVDRTREFLLNGSRYWYSTTSAPIRGSQGAIVGLVGITRDVTERKLQEQRIARLTRVHEMQSAVNAAIVRVRDPNALLTQACEIAVTSGQLVRALVCSAAAPELQLLAAAPSASSPTALLAWIATLTQPGASLADGQPVVLHANEAAHALERELSALGVCTLALLPLRVSGRLYGVFALCSEQAGGFDAEELGLLSALCDNLTLALAHGEQRERLDFLAYYDELTGLANRELLRERLSQRLAEPAPCALVLLDVIRFRHVSISLGRRAADALLTRIAERLQAKLEPHMLLAREGEHMFALFLPRVQDETQIAAAVENVLLPAFSTSFNLEGTELKVLCRVGIALAPNDGSSVDGLIAGAEAALKQVSTGGPRYLFCAPGMTERAAGKLALETRLRRAVELEQFELHYQPKVELKSGSVVGLEALVRWRDPSEGLVSPATFIPILEETGLILEMGRWVLQRAAAQFTQWSEQGLNPPPVAVNVSAIELVQPEFLQRVDAAIARYPLARSGIELEITESVLIDDFAGNIAKLKAVRERGLRVAIDDFGTGYSSLGYLSRLPVDALKIDRSFVTRMGEDPHDMTIVMAIISLAHSMDLKVIAEGPETSAQAQLLRLLKCDQLQGYIFARPQPAELVVPLFSQRMQLSELTR